MADQLEASQTNDLDKAFELTDNTADHRKRHEIENMFEEPSRRNHRSARNAESRQET